ncbi:hypothetical protein QJS10_CPB11g01229 [Acorus calamus]|uniref:Uncharacterized protein n=1 Tax=Acorus calamus TaxID=4465 RepID=A0AAV9DU89_ACOCL|nr:hypothetical protein QJS10_CPB11g01229 [Acorus calamus]
MRERVSGVRFRRERVSGVGEIWGREGGKNFVAVREVGRASSLMTDLRIVGGKGSIADAGDVWGDHRVVSP